MAKRTGVDCCSCDPSPRLRRYDWPTAKGCRPTVGRSLDALPSFIVHPMLQSRTAGDTVPRTGCACSRSTTARGLVGGIFFSTKRRIDSGFGRSMVPITASASTDRFKATSAGSSPSFGRSQEMGSSGGPAARVETITQFRGSAIALSAAVFPPKDAISLPLRRDVDRGQDGREIAGVHDRFQSICRDGDEGAATRVPEVCLPPRSSPDPLVSVTLIIAVIVATGRRSGA